MQGSEVWLLSRIVLAFAADIIYSSKTIVAVTLQRDVKTNGNRWAAGNAEDR